MAWKCMLKLQQNALEVFQTNSLKFFFFFTEKFLTNSLKRYGTKQLNVGTLLYSVAVYNTFFFLYLFVKK